MAKLWMSDATILSKLGEFLGIILRALVSSTYLMRSLQSDSSLFVITVMRITPSLVPWGTPPFSREFKQIATATSTTAVVDAVSWGEYVS